MRFYTKQHKFYCGIDLPARTIYVCVLKQAGEVLLRRNLKAAPDPCLKAVAPYREALVVCGECLFTWSWLADLCAQEGIPFVLGPALYLNAIHKGAFAEAAVLFLRDHPAGQHYLARLTKQHGKGKALTVLAHTFARAVYHLLKRETAFDLEKFLHA